MRNITLRIAALIAFFALAGQAFADDWSIVRLRGEVAQYVDGEWQPLGRGSIVPDHRVIRTSAFGHATLTRGNETIELAPNTQIQIFDRGGQKPFTTIVEHFGAVAVEAEVRNVQHFAVKNQYLAAVVKGTRFVVTARRFGASVDVQRGQVSVEATADHSSTMVVAGQRAKVDREHLMTVSGTGPLPAIVKKGTNSGNAAQAALAKAASDLAKAKATGDADAIKAAAEAAKAAEKAAKDQAKTDEKAAKDAEKAAEEAATAAEKAAKEAAKAAEKAAKAAGSGKNEDDSGDDKSKKH